MHKQGVVVKITEQNIVILCNDGTFQNIKRSRDQIPLLGERMVIEESKSVSLYTYLRAAAIACVLLLIFFSYGRFLRSDAAVAYVVAIDINPSIELQLNDELYTIGLVPLNEDGEKIIDAVQYKGKSLDETIELIVSQSVLQGFLDHKGKGLITSSIVPVRDEKALDDSRVNSIIQNALVTNKLEAEVQVATDEKETMDKAHELGLTVNKYKIYKSLMDKGFSISLEEVKENSIEKLVNLVGKPSDDNSHDSKELLNNNKDMMEKTGEYTDRPPYTNKAEEAERPVQTDNSHGLEMDEIEEIDETDEESTAKEDAEDIEDEDIDSEDKEDVDKEDMKDTFKDLEEDANEKETIDEKEDDDDEEDEEDNEEDDDDNDDDSSEDVEEND